MRGEPMSSKKPIGILAMILGGISLFLGIVVISVGLGSVVPAINKISGPIICGGDKVEVGQFASNPRPGETYVSLSIACVNEQTGQSEVKTLPIILTSGFIYSLIIFVPSFIWFIKHPDSWGVYE